MWQWGGKESSRSGECARDIFSQGLPGYKAACMGTLGGWEELSQGELSRAGAQLCLWWPQREIRAGDEDRATETIGGRCWASKSFSNWRNSQLWRPGSGKDSLSCLNLILCVQNLKQSLGSFHLLRREENLEPCSCPVEAEYFFKCQTTFNTAEWPRDQKSELEGQASQGSLDLTPRPAAPAAYSLLVIYYFTGVTFTRMEAGSPASPGLRFLSVSGDTRASLLVLGYELGTASVTLLLLSSSFVFEHVFEKWEGMEFTCACFLDLKVTLE